jgi:hypothetical protein
MPSECVVEDDCQPAVLSICAAARYLRLSRRQTAAAIGKQLIPVRLRGPVKVTTASVMAWKRQLSLVPDLDAFC